MANVRLILKKFANSGPLALSTNGLRRIATMLATLTEQNRYALAFRLHNLKTEAGRKRKIATFVEMLKRGETIYPQNRK